MTVRSIYDSEIIEEEEEPEPIHRLGRDLLDAARLLSRQEVRYIVDGYYQHQVGAEQAVLL